MKVLLYSEGLKYIHTSGVGRAIKHQMKALELNNISYTLDPKADFDVVHINTTGPASCRLAHRARKEGKKVIMHAHSTEEDFKDSFFFANSIAPIFKKQLIRAYGLGDEIITPTPYSKDVIDSYKIGPSCTAISNGVDIHSFKYDKEAAHRFIREYDFKADDKIVLSVGLQIKRKGILDFIEIAKEMPDYQFVWCGHTDKWLMTKEVRHKLKSLPENVHMIGYVNNMIGAYSACSLFFMPTNEETEGIVVLEALAIKKPVIIRDIPVYDKWLTHGVDCYKGKTNQEFKLLIDETIKENLNDTTKMGYKVVLERTLDKIGKQLINIYED